MNIAIRYYSKSGNTKKLADAISEVAGVEACTVDVPVSQETDLLFLGSSIYAAGVSQLPRPIHPKGVPMAKGTGLAKGPIPL